MLSELPTFLLSIGSFDSSFRNDKLFGITFFITRIVYHIILTIIFRKNNTMFYLSLAALSLHIYWFYGWFMKYGKKILFKKKLSGELDKHDKVSKSKNAKLLNKIKSPKTHKLLSKKSKSLQK
jgi:hypothetical protein